MKKMYTVCKKG